MMMAASCNVAAFVEEEISTPIISPELLKPITTTKAIDEALDTLHGNFDITCSTTEPNRTLINLLQRYNVSSPKDQSKETSVVNQTRTEIYQLYCSTQPRAFTDPEDEKRPTQHNI